MATHAAVEQRGRELARSWERIRASQWQSCGPPPPCPSLPCHPATQGDGHDPGSLQRGGVGGCAELEGHSWVQFWKVAVVSCPGHAGTHCRSCPVLLWALTRARAQVLGFPRSRQGSPGSLSQLAPSRLLCSRPRVLPPREPLMCLSLDGPRPFAPALLCAQDLLQPLTAKHPSQIGRDILSPSLGGGCGVAVTAAGAPSLLDGMSVAETQGGVSVPGTAMAPGHLC